MVRARLSRIGLAAALAAAAACSRGSLQGEDAGGTGIFGATAGRSGGSTGGSGGGQNCAMTRVPATMASLDLLVLLDASGSMSDDPSGSTCAGGCGAQSKWAQSAAAINSVVAQTDSYVNWGLMPFGNFGTDGCTVGNYPTVPVGPENGSAIATAFARLQNPTGGPTFGGSTPTRAAVNSAAGYFATVLDYNRQIIVLATDGVPNCAPGSSDPTADDSLELGSAIGSALEQGFQTLVVGVGSLDVPTQDALDRMAFAGGFPPPSPTSPQGYYPVSTTADLVATLSSLIASNSSCMFAIPYPPNDYSTRGEINVMIDGTEFPHDPAHINGWDYLDPGQTHLQFFGPACDATNPPGAHTVTVDFLCLLGI
jgi:hypothetical protein